MLLDKHIFILFNPTYMIGEYHYLCNIVYISVMANMTPESLQNPGRPKLSDGFEEI